MTKQYDTDNKADNNSDVYDSMLMIINITIILIIVSIEFPDIPTS